MDQTLLEQNLKDIAQQELTKEYINLFLIWKLIQLMELVCESGMC